MEIWLQPQKNYVIPSKKEKRQVGPITLDTLTEEQKLAADAILEYINSKSKDVYYCLLTGYAGTGKTYLISKLQEFILYFYKKSIAVTAPTNKAVKVLKDMSDIVDRKLKFMTIHKLLGLKPKISKSGQLFFSKDKSATDSLTDFNILFVDEVSMLSNELFSTINDSVKENKGKLKVIFIGDPAQIPPVGFGKAIPLMEEYHKKYKIKELKLTAILRTALDNPLLDYASFIRSNLIEGIDKYSYISRINHNQQGFLCIQKTEKDLIYSIANNYFDNEIFKNYPDFMKIIAWRNITVDAINDKVRRLIYKNIYADESIKMPRLIIGEKLIVDEPIIQTFKGIGRIIYNVNDEIEILDLTVKETKSTIVLDDGPISNDIIKYYECIVTNGEKNDKEVIRVIHEDFLYKYKNILQDIKLRIASFPEYQRPSNWARFYDFKNVWAAVKYNYAITAHKSQGSTYENCMILNWDMMLNPSIAERNQIRYVAVTRTKSRLFIIN